MCQLQPQRPVAAAAGRAVWRWVVVVAAVLTVVDPSNCFRPATVVAAWIHPGGSFSSSLSSRRQQQQQQQQPRSPNYSSARPTCSLALTAHLRRDEDGDNNTTSSTTLLPGQRIGDNDDDEDDDDVRLLFSSDTELTVLLSPQEMAKQYRGRAQQLRAEAMELELALNATRAARSKQTEALHLVERLFGTGGGGGVGDSNRHQRPLTAPAVARIIREERWNVQQVVAVLEALYQRQKRASPIWSQLGGGGEVNSSSSSTSASTTAAKASNETDFALAELYMQSLVEAADILDQEAGASSTLSPSSSLSSSSSSSRRQQQQVGGDYYRVNERTNRRWEGRGAQVLRSRLRELRRADEAELKRRVAAGIQAAVSANASIQEYMRRSLGLPATALGGAVSSSSTNSASGIGSGSSGSSSSSSSTSSALNESTRVGRHLQQQFNSTTRVNDRVSFVPMWVPSSLLTYIMASRAVLGRDDVIAIKDQVLLGSRFYCTAFDSVASAALFRGNIRPLPTGQLDPARQREHSAVVFAEVQQRMEALGLSSRIQLFLMPDPDWRPTRDTREVSPRPVILALPKSVVPDDYLLPQSWLATAAQRAAAPLALLTAFAYSVGSYALSPTFFESVVNKQDPAVLVACLPVFVGVVVLHAIHEAAHWAVARIRGMKIGKPVSLPSAQLGLFGCITPLRSFPLDRKALLDFALSGPATVIVLSIALMVAGAYRTVHASAATLSQFPFLPVAMLKSSFLTGSLLTFLAPKVMMLPMSQPIPVHPLFVIGFSGLLASALNLLPIFRLDGGRACTAAMGSRFGALASVGTLLFMLGLALSGTSGLAWSWGLIVLFLQRRPEIPTRDDVTEVDNARLALWFASLATAVLALMPFPGGPGFL